MTSAKTYWTADIADSNDWVWIGVEVQLLSDGMLRHRQYRIQMKVCTEF